MFWLNNLKISYKLSLIVALLCLVTAAAVGFASKQLVGVDASYSDLIDRVGKYTTMTVRAGRRADNYISSAFQLAAETTEAGNVRLYAAAKQNKQEFQAFMAEIVKGLPENAALLRPLVAAFDKVFATCDPIVDVAAKTTSAEGALKAAARLQAECVPFIVEAQQMQTNAVDKLVADSATKSDQLTVTSYSSVYTLMIASGIAMFIGLGLALWIGIKGLASPIAELKAVMALFANNDLKSDVPGKNRRDEVGEMARTVEVFKTNGLEVARLKDAQLASEQQAIAQRKVEMIKLANDFEGAVGEIIETVSSASTELEASANTLTLTAERSEQLATTVAAASEEASTNVQSVASATEEMASSVQEISRQVQDSARIAREAVDQARKTNDKIGELASAASRIGAVVELINNIAGQTNLLALNATIEAARAGEAGRGFAVVASEVKALAEQTAKATGEISQQIDSMQAATGESVSAIKEIGDTIARMSEISSTIASAVEEQGAATQEISRNVQQAAQGTLQVSSNITHVQRGASETGSASSQVLSAAQSLSQDSNRLKTEVGKFLNTVRAA